MQTPSPTDPDGGRQRGRSLGSRFRSDIRGETAIEYGLIASLIVLAILTALTQFGNASMTMYNKIVNAMSSSSQ